MAPRTRASAPSNDHNPKAEPGDNSAALEEAERVQLISFIGRATATAAAAEAAHAPYKAATKAHNQVFSLAKAANPLFTRKYLEKKMEEMNRSPAENARLKAMESRHDRWLGILSPEQTKMHLEPGTPQEARDEMDWRQRGYSQGLQGRKPVLPEGIPPRMDQPFLAGHSDGFKVYTEALNGQARPPSVAVQAATDFAADNPEVDVDAAARKLKNDPKFMERGASIPEGASTAEAPFEATEEELSQQHARQAVQERREGEEASGEVV